MTVSAKRMPSFILTTQVGVLRNTSSLHIALFDGCIDAGETWQVVGLSGPITGLHLKGQNLDPAVPPRTFVAVFTLDFIIFGETEPARASLAAAH